MLNSNQFFKNKIKNTKQEGVIKTIQKWVGKKYTAQQFQILGIDFDQNIDLPDGRRLNCYKIRTKVSSMEDSLTLILEGQAIHAILY